MEIAFKQILKFSFKKSFMNNKQEYDQTLEMARLCHISFADEKVFIAFCFLCSLSNYER